MDTYNYDLDATPVAVMNTAVTSPCILQVKGETLMQVGSTWNSNLEPFLLSPGTTVSSNDVEGTVWLRSASDYNNVKAVVAK